MVISLMLGPKDMTCISARYDQPGADSQLFTANLESNGFWKLVDPIYKMPTWYKIEGKNLVLRNDKGQTVNWPITEKMDISGLQHQSTTYTVPVKDLATITVSKANSGLHVTQAKLPGEYRALIQPLTITFSTGSANSRGKK